MNLNFIDKLYQKVLPIWGTDEKVKIHPVDFNQSWWKIILKFKWRMLTVIILELIFSSLNTLFPILVAWAISTGNVNNYFLILGLLVISLLYRYFREYIYGLSSASILASVNNSANQFFLAVDPNYHATRSSGQIISKVTRGVSSYESALDFIIYSLLYSLSGLASVIWALGYRSINLGIIAGLCLVSIIASSVIINIMVISRISKYRIDEEDKLKALTVENLQEVLLIRSTFATDIQVGKVENQSKSVVKHQINSWMISTLFFQITSIIHISSLAIIGYFVFDLLKIGSIDTVTAVALLATYSGGATGLIYIGHQVGRFVQQIKNIQDLFEFIRGFGKQTYPVLLTDNHENYEK